MKQPTKLCLTVAAASCAIITQRAHALTPTCEITGCGSNTPVLVGTPILALNLSGKPDERGVILNPTLTRVASPPPKSGARPCQSGAQLELRDGRFAGRDAKGPCADVRGMVFSLEVPVTCPRREAPGHRFPGCDQPAPKLTVQLRVEEEGSVDTWELPTPRPVPTYRLVWHQLPAASWVAQQFGMPLPQQVNTSICPRRERWMEQWQQVTPPGVLEPGPPTRRQLIWKQETDHLLLLQGEAYRHDATIDAARTGANWFQLACTGTSVAKMRLLGFDPMQVRGEEAAAAQERQATLKMLTARYRPEESYTYAGVPLMWKLRGDRAFVGQPDPGEWSAATVESHWDAGGARCLSHRRTWIADAAALATDLIARAMPEQLNAAERQQTLHSASGQDDYAGAEERSLRRLRAAQLPRCAAQDDGAIWTTYPVHHVKHLIPRLGEPKPRAPYPRAKVTPPKAPPPPRELRKPAP